MDRGYTLKYDVSLAPKHYYDLVEQTRTLIEKNFPAKQIETYGYGHIGDGNLHLNVTLPGYGDKDLQGRAYSLIDTFVMDYVRQAKGSISAEHGVGYQKA